MPAPDPPAPLPDLPEAGTQGRKFPCPSCGARLDYDPSAKGLKCPYCGYEKSVEKAADAEVVERDYMEYLDKAEAKGKAIPGRSSQTRCTGCGAMVLLEDKVATERCPFCNTHLENEPEAADHMVPPESVLPFAVDLRAARKAFADWIHGLWFAPSDLKNVVALGQLNGVYLPYWTYDSMTHTWYEGERGENYTVYESYTERTSDGRTETRTRPVTKIRWYPASGQVQHFFDDVLVCGSHGLPADLIEKLEPWDLPKLEPFRPDYLSGFKTERYFVGLRDGLKAAKTKMEPTILNLIRRDIGGDHQRIHDKKTRYSGITFKHLLLPTWVAVYRYHDKTFQILVNGRTGEVVGRRPWSWWKIGGLIAGIIVAVALLILLVQAFGKKGPKLSRGDAAPPAKAWAMPKTGKGPPVWRRAA